MPKQSKSDTLHDRIERRLNDLRADFKQLEKDTQAANQESRRARRDRLEGFKRALLDILHAVDRADREWT